MRRLVAIAFAVSAVACGTPSTAPAPSPSSIGSGSAEPREPAPVEAARRFMPAKIADDAGVAFAATQGGTIESTSADGTTTSIRDGAVLTVTAVNHVVDRKTPSVEVEIAGKRYTLPDALVLRESRLTRSPDHSIAVFASSSACPGACHVWIYVVDRDGRRKRLGDAWADHAVAWRADGAELAVGGAELWIVGLPSLDVRAVAGYTSPAYAPDGTLYVRDLDGSAFTLAADGEAVRVYKAPRRPAAEQDQGRFAGVNPPVSFDADGKPRFDP